MGKAHTAYSTVLDTQEVFTRYKQPLYYYLFWLMFFKRSVIRTISVKD